jgi:hypothetical protein
LVSRIKSHAERLDNVLDVLDAFVGGEDGSVEPSLRLELDGEALRDGRVVAQGAALPNDPESPRVILGNQGIRCMAPALRVKQRREGDLTI